MTRKEIIDICQISKARWMIHEASGKLPLPNKEEYSDNEALELIKYWRYARGYIRPWHNDYSKRQLAKFLGISQGILHKHIEKGNIPQPDKHIGLKKVYSVELANRIKATFDKWEYSWDRARKEGLFTPTETCRILGIDNKRLKRLKKPTRTFEGRLFYSKRDIRDLKRFLRKDENQNPDS